MPTFTLEAPAKVNLFLDVKPQLTDVGYHLLDTLMMSVSLYDSVTIAVEPLDSAGSKQSLGARPIDAAPFDIRFSPALSCDTCASSVHKALLAMHNAFKEGVFDSSFRIAIDKRIPEKSGLGGASSDAAAVILTLCDLWNLDPVSDEVIAVASKVGADVPYFLFSAVNRSRNGAKASSFSQQARAAYLRGFGEELAYTVDALNLNLVLVKPPRTFVSTQEAYALFDQEQPAGKSAQQFLLAYKAALKACDVFSASPTVPQDLMAPVAQELFLTMGNNLESVALKLAPDIEAVRRYLIGRPHVFATMLAGSGAAMFGICPALKDAEDIAYDAAEKGWWAQAVSTKCAGLHVLAL